MRSSAPEAGVGGFVIMKVEVFATQVLSMLDSDSDIPHFLKCLVIILNTSKYLMTA